MDASHDDWKWSISSLDLQSAYTSGYVNLATGTAYSKVKAAAFSSKVMWKIGSFAMREDEFIGAVASYIVGDLAGLGLSNMEAKQYLAARISSAGSATTNVINRPESAIIDFVGNAISRYVVSPLVTDQMQLRRQYEIDQNLVMVYTRMQAQNDYRNNTPYMPTLRQPRY